MGVVVLASGGVDSSVLLLRAVQQGRLVSVLWANYGQPAALQEWRSILQVLEALKQPASVLVDLPLTTLWAAPMQAAGDAGPRVVPGRNLVLLAHALNHAASVDADEVWYGAMGGDQAEYADCRPTFVGHVNSASVGVRAMVQAPVMHATKAQLVVELAEAGLLDLTWSCYEDGPVPCHACASCRSRDAALLGHGDPR